MSLASCFWQRHLSLDDPMHPLASMEVVVIGLGLTAGAFGYKLYQMKTLKATCPPSGPVPANKTRICIAGTFGPHDARAHKIASSIAAAHPNSYETWFYWTGADQHFSFVIEKFANVPFPEHLKGHATHPFVWLEEGQQQTITPIGGRDRLCEWVKSSGKFSAGADDSILELADGSVRMLDSFSHFDEMPASSAECAKQL